MTKENDGVKCPECQEGILHDGTRKEVYRYRGHSLGFEQPGAYCDHCGGGLITDAEAMPVDRILREFRQRVDAELPSHENAMVQEQPMPFTEPDSVDRILSERLDSAETPARMSEADWLLIRKHHALAVLQKARQGRTIDQEQILTFLAFWDADLTRIAREERLSLGLTSHLVDSVADRDTLPVHDLGPDQARQTINVVLNEQMTLTDLKQAVRDGRFYMARYSDHTGFPAWQFHPAVQGYLAPALALLAQNNKNTAQFWISEEEVLEGLSPAEVLAGLPFDTRPKITDVQHELLQRSPEQRWQMILDLINAPNPWETVG